MPPAQAYVGQGVRYFCLLSYVEPQFQGFCTDSGLKPENLKIELSNWNVVLVATCTSYWGTLELVCHLVSQ